MPRNDNQPRSYRLGYQLGRLFGRIAYGPTPAPDQPDQAPDRDHGEQAIPLTDCEGLTILHVVPCDDGTAVVFLGWPATDDCDELLLVAMTSQRHDGFFGVKIA